MDTTSTKIKSKFGEVISLYKHGLELELRFYEIDRKLFGLFYEKALEIADYGIISKTLQQLKNEDAHGDITLKEEREFNEKGQKISYLRKKRLWHRVFGQFPKYQLSLAEEENLSDEKRGFNAELMRFKLRSSLFIKKWRFDFTLVKVIPKGRTNDFELIKSAKNKIFPPSVKITTDNFMDQIDDSMESYDSLEFEIEYISKNQISDEQIDEIVSLITEWTDPRAKSRAEYRITLDEIKKILPLRSDPTIQNIKKIVKQPIDLTAEKYCSDLLPKLENFYLTEKADGERCLLCYTGKERIYLTTSRTDRINFKSTKQYIFDAEMVGEKFYAFDLILSEKSVIQKTLNERIDLLTKAVSAIKDKNLAIKTHIPITEKKFEADIDKVWSNGKNSKYSIDGLIFTEDAPYEEMSVYKWKPPEKSTIDFLIKSAHGSIPEKEGFTPYILFCGIKKGLFLRRKMQFLPIYKQLFPEFANPRADQQYLPIHFAPKIQSDAYIYYHPISKEQLTEDETFAVNRIGEFGWDFEKQTWIFHKMRPDKDDLIRYGIFGNDFNVAEQIFNGYKNPFTLDKLKNTDTSQCGYFREKKDPRYIPQIKFNNFVKAQLLRQTENVDYVMDLAGGRGSDMFTFHSFGVKNLIVLDKDQQALSEYAKRAEFLGQKKFYANKPAQNSIPAKNMQLHLIQMDLSLDHGEIEKIIGKKIKLAQVDAITCMFAIHYFTGSDKSIENIVNLIDHYLKPGGQFIFTCFDGQKIIDLLGDKKQFDMNDEAGLKYSIKKMFKEKQLTSSGQKISVLLPFSQGEYYEEYLVNIKNLLEKFCEKGYKVLQNGSFGDWFRKFEQANIKIAEKLTKNDLLYSSLYQYVSLSKSL